MNIASNVAFFCLCVWNVTITSAHIKITIAKALLDFAFCQAFYNTEQTTLMNPPLNNIKKRACYADQQ